MQTNVYRVFGRTAVLRGYVVWCPLIVGFYSEEHQPEEGPEARGRDILHKKAIITGHTLMGLEIAKIRRVEQVYQRLGLPDRARFASFEGPHQIDGTQSWTFWTSGWVMCIQIADRDLPKFGNSFCAIIQAR